MGNIICVFTAMVFTGIAGYLLCFVQHLCRTVEQTNVSLAAIALQIEESNRRLAAMTTMIEETRDATRLLASQTQQITSLSAGLYIQGDSDPKTGLTPLTPLRQNTAGKS